MALILCIETATPVCSVCLAKDSTVIALQEAEFPNQHASQLHLLIQQLFEGSGFTFKDLDAIAVSQGPGSYTGLRVGVASAKGLAYALSKPLIGVNTLHALAASALDQQAQLLKENQLLVPMIDARRMEVFCAALNQELQEVFPTQPFILNENSFENMLDQHALVFFGSGASKAFELLKHKNVVHWPGIDCSSTGLVKLAEEAFKNSAFADTAYFEPFYGKDFVGTTPKIKS